MSSTILDTSWNDGSPGRMTPLFRVDLVQRGGCLSLVKIDELRRPSGAASTTDTQPVSLNSGDAPGGGRHVYGKN
jgi:hypothetical protein